MSLQEFDALVGRMNLAFEYAENLGQYVDAAKILYQINGQLPDDLQLFLEDIESHEDAKPFIIKHKSEIRSKISDYRQQLTNC